jgi:hypothetical protein
MGELNRKYERIPKNLRNYALISELGTEGICEYRLAARSILLVAPVATPISSPVLRDTVADRAVLRWFSVDGAFSQLISAPSEYSGFLGINFGGISFCHHRHR